MSSQLRFDILFGCRLNTTGVTRSLKFGSYVQNNVPKYVSVPLVGSSPFDNNIKTAHFVFVI